MFTPKEKEPQLSEHMEKVILHSMGVKNDSNTDEIIRFKKKIMEMLTSNQDIINTLHCSDMKGKNGEAYRDKYIFDYMFLPDLKDKVNNYICFEVKEQDPEVYDTRVNKNVIFRTVCHKDDIETDWGISRQDLLASIIKNEFDWSNSLGLTMVKTYDVGLVTDDDYYYRELCYVVLSPNNLYNR